MNRDQLAHVVRVAKQIAGDPGILVIGSQAILATMDSEALPETATRSVEADIVFFDDPDDEKADRVDALMGEESEFHHKFGYYGQGVSMSTAVLPKGWRDRLIPFEHPGTGDAEAWCLEACDIAVAKLMAGREKDFEYVTALLDAGVLDLAELRSRIALIPDVQRRQDALDWTVRYERKRS